MMMLYILKYLLMSEQGFIRELNLDICSAPHSGIWTCPVLVLCSDGAVFHLPRAGERHRSPRCHP